jgi:hypothetical protein
VPRIPAGGGVEPGAERVRPEPAVAALFPEAGRCRGLPLPLLPPFFLLPLLFRAVRLLPVAVAVAVVKRARDAGQIVGRLPCHTALAKWW